MLLDTGTIYELLEYIKYHMMSRTRGRCYQDECIAICDIAMKINTSLNTKLALF